MRDAGDAADLDDAGPAFLSVAGHGVVSVAAARVRDRRQHRRRPARILTDTYLDTIEAETTLLVLEAETVGAWRRDEGGYRVVADGLLKQLTANLPHNPG